MTTTSATGPITVRIKDPSVISIEAPVAPPVPPIIEPPQVVLVPTAAINNVNTELVVMQTPPEVKMPVNTTVTPQPPAVVVVPPNVTVPTAVPAAIAKRTTTVTQQKPLAVAPPPPKQEPLLIKPESKGVRIFQWFLIIMSMLMVLAAGGITYTRVHDQNQIARPHSMPADDQEETTATAPTIEKPKKVEENEIEPDDRPTRPTIVPPAREKKPVRIAPIVAQSVIGSKKYYTSYLMTDLSVEKRTGGSRSWRLNNPGRLVANQFTKAYGSIGVDGGLAIFPSYAHGERALIAMLFERPEMQYNHLSLQAAMQKFVPSKYADEYVTELIKLVPGIKSDMIMSTVARDTRKEIAKAIEQLELFQFGRIEKYTTEQVYKEKG